MARIAAFLGLASLVVSASAAVTEMSDCAVLPDEVKFVREANGWLPDVTTRYEKYPGGELVRMFKNPEGVFSFAPLHAKNCTPGSRATGTQVLTFKVKGANYFGTPDNGYTGVANHLAVLVRGVVLRQQGNAAYGQEFGRGLALFRHNRGYPSGAYVEFFTNGGIAAANHYDPRTGGTFALRDDTWLEFAVHATSHGIAYWMFDAERGVLATGYQADTVSSLDAGYGFGALCIDANGACEEVERFELHFKDIAVSWF